MNKFIVVTINVYNKNNFYLKLLEKNINIKVISEDSKTIKCLIKEKDYQKIKYYYDIKINKKFDISTILKYLTNNIIFYSAIIFGIIVYIFFTNLIINVKILCSNQELATKLSKSLDNYGIKRLTFKKNYQDIDDIKNKLMEEYHDNIEWLEISLDGMQYVINLEERIMTKEEEKKDYCNIYATTDAIVTKVLVDHGTSLINEFSYVRKGDTLISGDIKLNEEIKSSVCAEGKVYGEVWYELSISVPKTYEETTYTGKNRYNLELEVGNNDYLIFKSRLENKVSEKKLILSLLGRKLYLVKEKEVLVTTKNYSEEDINKKIDEVIEQTIKLNEEEKEKILYKKVLKKYEFDSKINIEVFVSAERIISST